MSFGAAALSLSAYFYVGRIFKNLKPRQRLLVILGLSWSIFSILNLLLRPRDTHTLHTLSHLPYFLIPMLALQKRPASKRLDWVLISCSLGVAIAFAATLYYWGVQGLQGAGLFKNPIYYAYASFPAFLFFGEIARQNLSFGLFTAKWALVTALVAFAGITLSETRMVLALSLVYLALAVLPILVKRYGLKAAFIALSTLSVVFVGIYSTQVRVQEKVARTKNLLHDPSMEWRLVAWKHNWNLFLASPLLGSGPERNGIDVAKQPEFKGHWDPGYLIFAHSIYFQSLGDSGLIGTILFFGFFICFSLCFPLCTNFLIMMGIVGITENIFQNAKAALPFYFYLLMSAMLFQKKKKGGTRGTT